MTDDASRELYRLCWKVGRAHPDDKPRLRRRHINLLKQLLDSKIGRKGLDDGDVAGGERPRAE